MGNKSVNNLYKPMLEHSNVEQKFHKAAKGQDRASGRCGDIRADQHSETCQERRRAT